MKKRQKRNRRTESHNRVCCEPAVVEPLECRQLFSLAITGFSGSPLATMTNALISSGTGINLTGSSYVGEPLQGGTYTGFSETSGSTTLAIGDGIILTSGLATNALGPNNNTGIDKEWGDPGDSDLNALVGVTTHDANSITIQFTTNAGIHSVGFDLIFGSDEFPEFVGSFNDAFGAYLDGTQVSTDGNGNPLSVNNDFFTLDNSGTNVAGKTHVSMDLQYDGLTPELHTQASLNSSISTHTLKLVIADAGDDEIDSGIFLANLAGSTANPGGSSTGVPATNGSFQFNTPTVSVANTAGTATLTVNRVGGSTGAATVDYATSDGTAIAGTDYTSTSGTLNFSDGQTSATITVPVTANTAAAASTAFTAALSNATGGATLGSTTTGTVTLTNANSNVQVAAPTYSYANDSGNASITVIRTGNTASTGTVQYSTTNGTATAGTDYTSTSGTLTFTAGQTSKTITVPLIANAAGSASSTFTLTLASAGGNAVLGSQTASTVTVTNTHSLVQIASATYSYANTASTGTITVIRSGITSSAGQVDYTTTNGTATAGTDYTTTTGTLSFLAGDTSKTITVPLIANAAGAASSTFTVAISNPGGNAVLGSQTSSTVTLTNSNSLVQVSSPTYSYANDAGTATITVTRTGITSSPGHVDYATADGSAIAGTDYTATTGTLSFNAGQTSKTISIPLSANYAAGASSTFSLTLSNPGGNAVLGSQNSSIVTLTNTHSLVQIAAPTYIYANGVGSATISVTRTGVITSAGQVDYSTSNGTAVAGADYTSTSGTLSFSPGQSSKTIGVPLIANALGSPSSTFIVTIANAGGNAVIGSQTSSTVTVTNPNSLVQVASTTYTYANNAGSATITVTRGGNTTAAGQVDYATSDGTANAGSDYVATSGTLSFLAGDTSKTITVPLIANSAGSASSTFALTLSNAGGNAQLGNQTVSTVTVTNSQSQIQMSVASYGFAGTAGSASLTVTRTGNLSATAQVDYATADGTAITGIDYTSASGTVHFAAGVSSQTISIPLIADPSSGTPRAFTLTLSNVGGNGVLGSQSSATITVIKDYSQLQFTQTSSTNANDTGSVVLTVTRVGVTSAAGQVDYMTTDGTASAGVDYTAASGTLLFATGETSKTITVPLIANAAGAPTSTFTVSLTNVGGNAILGPQTSSTITVENNHSLVQVDQTSYSFANDTGPATITVTRTGNLSAAAQVGYATSDGTAIDGTDYTGATGTINFTPGRASVTVEIPLLANAAGSSSSTFLFTLSGAAGNGVQGADSVSTITVLNNHSLVQIGAPTYSVTDNAGAVDVTVQRTGNISQSATLEYTTADGTALAGTNYVANSGSLNFLAGESTKTISVAVLVAPSTTLSHSFTLSLSSPAQNAVLGARTSVTISVTVTPIVASVAISSASRLDLGSSMQLTAIGTDQFGAPIALSQVVWSLDAGSVGSIDQNGLFTAGNTVGSAVIRATSGGQTVSTTVAVNSVPTIIANAYAQIPSPTSSTGMLHVFGDQDGSDTNLIYTWEIISQPSVVSALHGRGVEAALTSPAPLAIFSINGTHDAKNTAVTFLTSGTYVFRATASDGLMSASSDVQVTVKVKDASSQTTLVSGVRTVGDAKSITGFVVTFNGPLDPTTAQDVRGYRILQQSTAGNKLHFAQWLFGINPGSQTKTSAYKIASAAYDSQTDSVTLTLAAPMPVKNGVRLLQVLGTGSHAVLDANRKPIDGDSNGKVGGTFTYRLNMSVAKNIAYKTADGDTVKLSLSGPGEIVSMLPAGDTSPVIFLSGTDPASSVLTGKLHKSRKSLGYAVIDQLNDASQASIQLGGEFHVNSYVP